VDVWIIDVTPGIVAAAILAETTIEAGNARPPIPFKLRYDPSRVFTDHDYAIKAVIRSAGETLFEMPNDFRVLTKGHPTRVEVWVKKVEAAGGAAPAGLAGTSWRVEDLGGEKVPADAEGTLDFPDAGRVAGRAFCNRFSGKVETSGSSIRFGPLAVTKMACGQSANEREARFLQALHKAERYSLDGETLQVYFAGSERPLRLARRQP
jgi:putative lipoprotein